MTKFESEVKQIPYPQNKVFEKLSDMRNLERVKDKLPEDKVKNLEFDENNIKFEVAPVGKISIAIVEKEPCKCIKFGSVEAPMAFNIWIQLLPVTDNSCKMKITLGVELNMFMKAMVQKPLKEGVEKMAEMLAMLPYGE